MAELHHECEPAAVYYLPNRGASPLLPKPDEASRLIPRMLLEMQNRPQLAAGVTTYNVRRNLPLGTHKEVGSVAEVFLLNHGVEFERLMVRYAGVAAIGHACNATGEMGDRSDAQPVERHHIEKSKWFSIAFNGQIANYRELRDELLSQPNLCLARGTDTEIVMHLISQEYNIVFLNALGDMFVARDPQGIRPMCYAVEGPLFAAADERLALAGLGFRDESIKNLEPGHTLIIESGVLTE